MRWFLRHPWQWVRWRSCEVRAWWDAGPWLRPVPDPFRCIMGYPLGIQCRRPAVRRGDVSSLWCAKHEPEARP